MRDRPYPRNRLLVHALRSEPTTPCNSGVPNQNGSETVFIRSSRFQGRTGLRILHFIHTFGPLTHGGIETYLSMTAQEQRRAGDEVRIVAVSNLDDEVLVLRRECVDQIGMARVPFGLQAPNGPGTRSEP